MKGANKVVFNTAITYARAVITSLISLYSTRLILSSLGAEDFGLFNVVGGVVGVLTFLNAAMTTSTQRYLSFNLGKGDISFVEKIFANSVILHFIIGVIIIMIVEIGGMYFIQNKLQIVSDRLDTATNLLHFAVATTFITVISVPYDAVINAHENMLFLAVVNIIEAFLKLFVALSLLIIPGDKLFYFGVLTMVSAIIIRIIKGVYSRKNYNECRVAIWKHYDFTQMKDMTSFAGWQMFGSLSAIARNQGAAVILNLFYSTVVNAAYGVANQLNGQLMFFSQTMMSAVRPQIMKSEGANNRNRMIALSLSANRLAFFLFTFFSIPLFFQMEIVLSFWLGDTPKYTVEFCRAILLLTMATQINMGLMTAVQAIGKVKTYQVVAGGIQLFTLPVGFILLKIGYPPYSIIIASVILECISTIFKVFYFRFLTGYSVYSYFINVFLKSTLTMMPTLLIVYIMTVHMQNSWKSFLLIFFASCIIYSGCIWVYGLDSKEKNIVKGILVKVKNKFG